MHSIIPLDVGTFDALPKQTCTYRMYREVTYRAPCVIWSITGTRDNILVDLGPPDPPRVLESQGFVMLRGERQQPRAALQAVGVDPCQVRTVILTHLHWDHAWGFHLFENARFIIQKKELEYALSPLPCHRPAYYGKPPGQAQFVDYLDRLTVIEGDAVVEPGVEAVFIPSHTPGFQGVAVDTEKGRYFIAGDAVGLYECWETVPHIPSGIFNNLEDCYRSADKIERIADHVLPGHDARVFDRPSYP
ncbi:MAG: N-acyl homoserine lactonase family protein [Proteobacteria bacterium]|nr:N-acyl homoserine lactonase family protein [Pseudomonadota bacterium]